MAVKFATFAVNQEHIPLGESMIAMAIKAISVAGMGRFFMDEKEIQKLTSAYEDCWHEMEARLAGPSLSPDSDREKKFQQGRTYMKEMVKNMMNRRRHEEHKDETLFLDSILDCDLMDEEEVTADAHLLSVFDGFLPKRPFSPQNPKSEVIIPKTTLRECNKVLNVLYCRRM